MTVAFVTGVTGQDGSYLAERLLADGVEVHGLVYAGAEQPPPVPGVIAHPGDLADVDALAGLLDDLAPDLVFNLAGVSSVGLSWEHPGLTARLSGVAALELMQVALEVQERTGKRVGFLQASSSEIFGQAEHAPQDESTPVRPVNPYGIAKAMAHQSVDVYRHRGLHATSCILFNHESPRRPPTFVTRKITQAVARIHAGTQDRLTLGTLDVRRDWGWAPDYVDAMVRAVRHERAQDYVIATGEAHSIGDFVGAAFARVGIEDWSDLVDLDPALTRPADPSDVRGDSTRARTELGWAPTLSFEEIVARLVDADLALVTERKR